jgi:hypothetical protein
VSLLIIHILLLKLASLIRLAKKSTFNETKNAVTKAKNEVNVYKNQSTSEMKTFD